MILAIIGLRLLPTPTAARAVWAAGADGVYRFNYHGLIPGNEPRRWRTLRPGEILDRGNVAVRGKQIGDSKTLAGLDKLHDLEWRNAWDKFKPSVWPHQLTVNLVEGRPLKLVVADDLEQAAGDNKLKELRQQLRVSAVTAKESIVLEINGVMIDGAEESLPKDIRIPGAEMPVVAAGLMSRSTLRRCARERTALLCCPARATQSTPGPPSTGSCCWSATRKYSARASHQVTIDQAEQQGADS